MKPLRLSISNATSCTTKAVRLAPTSSKRYSQSASDKLFEDAAREEAEVSHHPRASTSSSHLPLLENQHENWYGDERIEDAVLRMLVDKYKPLRTGGGIHSAEEKLKSTPPRVTGMPITAPQSATNLLDQDSAEWSRPRNESLLGPTKTGSWATEPLLSGSETHQPWHTEFKAPEHAKVSVKHALRGSLFSGSRSGTGVAHATTLDVGGTKGAKPLPADDKERRKEVEERRKAMQAGRLVRAKESTLDYRLGIKGGGGGRQANPISLKGWASMVEDRIQKAQKAGLFNNIKGKGQPLKRSAEESNPFLPREEHLMNRIVQRNGAAPPWVELQNNLDVAVASFRDVLKQSWVRQAVRSITSSTPPSLLRSFSRGDIKAFRDEEWEEREESYHDLALEELNSLVRKYNGVAPYVVRRPYYLREVEFERLYKSSVDDILEELAMRAEEAESGGRIDLSGGSTDRRMAGQGASDPEKQDTSWSLRKLFWAWIGKRIGWPR